MDHISKMQSLSYSYVEADKKTKIAQNIEDKFQDVHRKNYNWKLSYTLLDSSQQNVALQYKASYILCVSIFEFPTNGKQIIILFIM